MDVIIPTRNRPDLTLEAVAAVRAQTYPHWHLWVVDDASTDETPDRVEAAVSGDQRVSVIRLPRRIGANPARQVALDRSDAPLVATCDSDDLWTPDKLARQVLAHQRAGAADAIGRVGPVICWHDARDLDGSRRGPVLRPRLSRRWHPFTQFNTSTPLFERELLVDSGGFTPTDPYRWHTTDHLDLFLRTTRHRSLVVVPEVLVHCRHHGGERNSDAERTLESAAEAEALLTALAPGLMGRPSTLAWLNASVAGRYLEAGDQATAAAFLAAALRQAPPQTATAMVAHYAPWALRRLLVGARPKSATPTPTRSSYSTPVVESRQGPAMTVVVMAYQNQATVVQAVASVVDQIDGTDSVEVVLVTSGGDSSAALVRDTFPEVKVVESSARLMPGGARNAGVAASKGQILAFLAADCVAEPGWVSSRLAAHREGFPVVAGAMTSLGPHRPWTWASNLVLFRHRLTGRSAQTVAPSDPAAHGLSFDRSVLERLGPFDAGRRVGEDTEMALRVGAAGLPIWFDPAVRTAHRGPTDTRAMVVGHHRRGRQAVSAARAAGALDPISPGRAVAAAAVVTLTEVSSALSLGWRYSRHERLRLVAAAPWVVLAVIATVSGRYRERLSRRPVVSAPALPELAGQAQPAAQRCGASSGHDLG